MTSSELLQKRTRLGNDARAIIQTARNESRGLNSAETTAYDAIDAQIKGINGLVTRERELDELRADVGRFAASGGAAAVATESHMSYTARSDRPGEVRALAHNEAVAESRYSGPGLGTYVRGVITGRWNGAEELRALAEGSTPGSYLIPTPLSAMTIDLVRNKARVIEAGAVTVPMESSSLKLARQTGDVSANWKTENVAGTFSDSAFDLVTFQAQLLMAGSKLSIEICEDAANIDAIVTNSIVKSLALEVDRVALYGTGIAPQPRGVKNQTGIITTDLGATAGFALVDYAPFSKAIAALMGANFDGPFGILYSARTAGSLDSLQDTLHQPLRQPDLVAAARKLVTSQIPNNLAHGSASTASDAFIGAWGNCMIGMRTALMLEISRQAGDSGGSAFTNAQVWLRAYLRADIALSHSAAFNVLTGIL